MFVWIGWYLFFWKTRGGISAVLFTCYKKNGFNIN
jgi:hypothetical protein